MEKEKQLFNQGIFSFRGFYNCVHHLKMQHFSVGMTYWVYLLARYKLTQESKYQLTGLLFLIVCYSLL